VEAIRGGLAPDFDVYDAATWIVIAVLLTLSPPLIGAEPPIVSNSGGWELSTDDTRIDLAADPAGPTVSWLGPVGMERNWLTESFRVPLLDRVWIESRESPVAWTFRGGSLDAQGEELTLTYASEQPPLALQSRWRARRGAGPIQHRVTIRNLSPSPVVVSHQDSLSLRALRGADTGNPDAPARITWIRRGGGNATTQGGTFHAPVQSGLDLVLPTNPEDGASPVPWLAIQEGAEHGLYVGWEFSGVGRIHARADADGRVALDIGNDPQFKTTVPGGADFEVPSAFVGCHQGDLDEGSYRLHRFILEKLRPPTPHGVADPLLAYNLYLDVGGNQAKEADVLRSAQVCRALGFEVFVPDAMWFPETGDWRWDTRRFPKGAQPIEQYVHEQEMKLGLWCAWTNGGISDDPGSLRVRGPGGHPDWFRSDVDADWRPGPFWGIQICLGCREAKDWAAEKTRWLVEHHKLDYLKHDITPIVTQCDKTGHQHTHGTDVGYWAARAYYDIQDGLLKKFPRLVLENCSGGGHIKDFGVIQRTHYTVTTDTLSNLPNRQSLYDSTFAFPPVLLQAYTYDNYYPVQGDSPGSFLWRSAMMGAWQIDPTDTPTWTEEEHAATRRCVTVYKQWIRDMLPGVKVHHILPRPDGVEWDGLFYWNHAMAKGTLYVFRPDALDAERTVRLRGLDPALEYALWCEDGSIPPGVHLGRALMDEGLRIRLPSRFTSDLIFIQEAARHGVPTLAAPGEFSLNAAETDSSLFRTSARLSWQPSADATKYWLVVAKDAAFRERVVERFAHVPSATIPSLPPATDLYWKVESIGPGARRENRGGATPFRTPPARAAKGIAFVSDLKWVRATAGAENPVRRDRNYYDKPIAINGREYEKGVWTHAFPDTTPADIVVRLDECAFGMFAADVGVDDAAGGGSLLFQVWLDGRLAAESPVMGPRGVHPMRVTIDGAKELTLRVLNADGNYACDHAVWGYARCVERGAVDVLDRP